MTRARTKHAPLEIELTETVCAYKDTVPGELCWGPVKIRGVAQTCVAHRRIPGGGFYEAIYDALKSQINGGKITFHGKVRPKRVVDTSSLTGLWDVPPPDRELETLMPGVDRPKTVVDVPRVQEAKLVPTEDLPDNRYGEGPTPMLKVMVTDDTEIPEHLKDYL